MFDAKVPPSELPSPAQLRRSGIIAVAVAAFLAVGIVLPAEYGTDPTGIGRLVGLTDMGEIKVQLAREAAADRALDEERSRTQPASPDKRSSLLGAVIAEFGIRPAAAQAAPAARSQEMSVTLKPNEGAEIKLEMKKGAKATYSWTVSGGGNVNYDMHGEPHNAPPKSSHSYKTGRFTESDKGTLEAKFDGDHGWFWRNRSGKEVTVTVRAEGDFTAMKRVL